MKNPVSIGTLIIHIASDPKDDLGKVLRQLPFVQEQLLAQGKMSLEDLSDEQLDRLIGTVFDWEWVVESDAVGFGGISPFTLHALEYDGLIQTTRFNGQKYYKKEDLLHYIKSNRQARRRAKRHDK